jgi:hypothetical protein
MSTRRSVTDPRELPGLTWRKSAIPRPSHTVSMMGVGALGSGADGSPPTGAYAVCRPSAAAQGVRPDRAGTGCRQPKHDWSARYVLLAVIRGGNLIWRGGLRVAARPPAAAR